MVETFDETGAFEGEQKPLFEISSIQRKADGSFVVQCNGYPYHATLQDTPGVFQQVLKKIEDGAEVSDFMPPAIPGNDAVSNERIWRDAELERVRWLRERHRDEVEVGAKASLRDEQYRQLLTYIQALRDWPQSMEFPDSVKRPVAPNWLVDQV